MSMLIMLCGIPASGKSTFAEELQRNNENTVWVSRDDVRFSIIKEDEAYFSHEDEVVDQFMATINEALADNMTVIADATHLNEKSRVAMLERLTVEPDEINVFWFNTPLEVALERNNSRAGTRRFVPRGVIRRMSIQFRRPKFKEGRFTVNHIYQVDIDGKITEVHA